MKIRSFVVGWIVGVLMVLATSVFASDGIERIEAFLRSDLPVKLDGEYVQLENDPVMYEGSTYIHLRELSSLLPIDIHWNNVTREVELTSLKPKAGEENVLDDEIVQPTETVEQENEIVNEPEEQPANAELVQKQIEWFGRELTTPGMIDVEIKTVETDMYWAETFILEYEMGYSKDKERYTKYKEALPVLHNKMEFLEQLKSDRTETP